ncbi:MAG: DMT family transporter [Pseudomonadota bacterium]
MIIASGVIWGFYWLPVRMLAEAGLPGAWGTFAITTAAALLLAPFAAWHHQNLRDASFLAIGAVALGGAAFALYSIAFLYGRVAIVVLLFFLTPVWSTLIGRYIFGWPTPHMRLFAIAVGLLGLGVMLSAADDWPIPRNAGEWMGLMSGIMWSLSSTGMRTRSTLVPQTAALVFVLGAVVTSLMIALIFTPLADIGLWTPTLPIAFATGAVWWGAALLGLMWATVRLEPARVGILLMSEVLVGALSAALIAGEHLSARELIGGGLVLAAGVLEIYPIKDRGRATGRS